MRKVELSLREKEKYEIIKKLVETNGNKERARIKLRLKSIRQVNRLIAGYKEFGKLGVVGIVDDCHGHYYPLRRLDKE